MDGGRVSTRDWRLGLAAVACFGIAVALSTPAAHAIRAADMPPPAAAAVRAANPPSPQALRAGRLGAVDRPGQRVRIDGLWWRVDPARTLLLRRGQAAGSGGLSLLAAGQRVLWRPADAAEGATGVVGIIDVP